ncbi:hypothetical protein A1O1_05030 [Capronia coronata CBS 617.96]|uniref:Fibronectin type-III domain-containing protein n=1 Tax=Capronia coronata CBS 617.96 TaxID=1182541 RepID=W9Y5J6_9EURO|nr:uncharacterized protein A1O1_05030 [Capronia coronata CBS 617.96]EXJ88102.1 hypothetical protein A1O1_05030 [Capronia coronata CBS 617.96]
MDSSRWHQEPFDWASHAYHLLAPRVNVKGRMALVLLVAVIWAFSWLLWRAYSVIKTPNEILVEKLGLDIPPTPLVTLEEISSREVQISWKHAEPSTSVQEHHIEVNGRVIGTTRKNEMGAIISNLNPGHIYDIRVFCISAGTFQTPSAALHVRLPGPSSTSSQDGSSESTPTVRAIPVRSAQALTPLVAPAMTRELSGGLPTSRRVTSGRRPSPANHGFDLQHGPDGSSKGVEDEVDGDLAELSQRFQKVQQDIEAVEAQIQEEDKEFETALKDLEARRDELKQSLKERDEASNDLRKQVHKAETASRTAQSEKTKKERLLQQKENQRRKRKDEIVKWEDQIASMKEEMAGIETQKAAIERRTQSELREIRKKIEEEQKEVAMLEEDNREKALQIKALEEERQQLNVEDETDETREAERLDRERDLRWRARFDGLQQTYARLWNDLQLANQQVSYTREQITQLESRRANSIAFAAPTTLDLDALRRGMRPGRRPRHTNSHGSSISSPRGPFAGPEPFPSGFQYTSNPTNASPTTMVPSYFNPQNGMTLTMPVEVPSSHVDDAETVSSMPMSPRADSLLPADLLGDESADELPDTDEPGRSKGPSEGVTPFPMIGSPMLHEIARRTDTPSAHSSSSKSFSSPLQTSAPAAECENKSSDSGGTSDQKTEEAIGEDEDVQQPSKPKYMSMSSMFGLNRQRGKTLADQAPALGSLKAAQSRSFPRNVDEFDPGTQPRRRLSYGGNWAFPGTLLRGNGNPEERDQEASRFSSTRRAFLGFGKSTGASGSYDPFAARSGSFDPGLRAETSSPRPSSTYSFDKLPRPSLESQFRAWNSDKPPIRNSPLAPDWGSLHSFSRSHSRRPSFVYNSTSNLSLPADEEVIEPDRVPSRPLQAPIGTRPASSQQASTPKLNPAAPSFTMLFGKRGEKAKDKSRAKDSKERVGELEATSSPPDESRKSRDTSSITNTISTFDSEPLDRTASGTSAQMSFENTPVKPTFISKLTRKASSNKFGSWKDKGGLFSRREAAAPNGENEEEQGSSEHLGKSLESTSTTPSAEDKKSSRSSLSNWNFMRKSKKGREDLTASEISESSEKASETGEERDDDEA